MDELNVKVGDKVLVSKGSRYYKNNDFIAEVEKVTPTGRIRFTIVIQEPILNIMKNYY